MRAKKNSARLSFKGGNRAEVRRERKKRDILSPVNVPLSIFQKAL
jgi:hypothetical protein